MRDEQRGHDIARRMDRLGISTRELAQRVDVDRQTVARARSGESRPATFGAIEAFLDRLEAEIHGERIDEHTTTATTIVLPDGTQVTYSGGTAADAAEFARTFLANRRRASEPRDTSRAPDRRKGE